MGVSRDEYIGACQRGRSPLGSVWSGRCPRPVTSRQLVARRSHRETSGAAADPNGTACSRGTENRMFFSSLCIHFPTLFTVILTIVFYLMTNPHP